MEKIKLPILLSGLLDPKKEKEILRTSESDPFGADRKKNFFGPSGRWLLSEVFKYLKLKRTDEIAILTTSSETYVSICVSVAAFNYTSISRVVTPKTKVIVVIHEHGFVYPQIDKKAALWRRKKIKIIEDCAHLIGLDFAGQKIGSFGDYALFSLTKILPVDFGGLLRTSVNFRPSRLGIEDQKKTKKGILGAKKFLTKIDYFNQERLKRAEIIRQKIKKPDRIEPSIGIPFFVRIKTKNKQKYEQKNSFIEFGATLEDDLLLIPTNPLVDEKIFQNISF